MPTNGSVAEERLGGCLLVALVISEWVWLFVEGRGLSELAVAARAEVARTRGVVDGAAADDAARNGEGGGDVVPARLADDADGRVGEVVVEGLGEDGGHGELHFC